MKLLRKMSAVGLGPEDVDPYKRKEQLVGADAAPAPQNITLLAAFFAPLLWAPWGSMIYMACLPLMFAVVWLASSMPQEIARIKDRALVDEEQTILASVAASSRCAPRARMPVLRFSKHACPKVFVRDGCQCRRLWRGAFGVPH